MGIQQGWSMVLTVQNSSTKLDLIVLFRQSSEAKSQEFIGAGGDEHPVQFIRAPPPSHLSDPNFNMVVMIAHI